MNMHTLPLAKLPETLRVIRDEHVALSVMLQSLQLMLRQGPGEEPRRFFDTLSAMLLYIDEFPEKQHHRKESDLLFPRVAALAPHTREAIERLERDHQAGEASVRELQHLLLAWRFLGETRRQAFADAMTSYVAFYRAHMQLEESEILPAAKECLKAEDWAELDMAFKANRDPLTGQHPADGVYEQLFKLIAHDAPAPIGLGG